MWSKQVLLTLQDYWLSLWYPLTVLKLRPHCNVALRNILQSKKQKMFFFRSEIMVLNHVVFSFVCVFCLFGWFFVFWFLFYFVIAYIFRSFVLSHQIEFAVVLNRSLVTFNTMHKLYAGFMSSGLYTDYK